MSDGRPTVAEIRALLATATGTRLERLIEEYETDPRAGVRSAVASAMRRKKLHDTERRRLARLYGLEGRLRSEGCRLVAGVDEVGRGALAGPLSVGACVLPDSPRIEGLNDSKQLTPQRREELAVVIKRVAIEWSVAHVSPSEIDSLGMTAALKLAVVRALDGLPGGFDHVVVDGRPLNVVTCETAVVKGDSSVAAVAAASIIAKVERDALMVALSDEFPAYGFAINKGYGTADHLGAIDTEGMCEHHRRSFCHGGGTGRLF